MLKAAERIIRHRLRGVRPDSKHYTPAFFANQREGSRASAAAVVPLVLDFIKARSMIDVGCGVGTWAAEFMKHSIEVMGVDGSYVRTEDLQIPADRFKPINLNSPPPAAEIGHFDLAICLEVAEHVEAASSQALLTFLTDLAPNILFGAAIPGQGGRNHINEQWQSHWIGRFAELGFFCHDVIRSRVWTNPSVRPWYAQNTFLFTREPLTGVTAAHFPPDVVHPETWNRKRRR